MKITAKDVDRFVARPDPKVCAILLYGPDGGLIRERMNVLTRGVVDDLADPFRISDLTDSDLRGDPARLADEAAAISMLGGRRVVRLRGAGDSLSKGLEAFLQDPKGDALLLVEAGELTPRSSLRRLFEDRPNAAALPCFSESGASLSDTIRRKLAADHLDPEPAALHYLTTHLGSDRGVTMNELEKLVLYIGPGKADATQRVTLDDVRACVGDNAESGLDAVVDATAGGDLADLDMALTRARSADTHSVVLLNAVSRHLIQLHLAMDSLENGVSADNVVNAIRPMVHFSRKPKMKRQLSLWTRKRLDRALAILAEADRQCKTTGLPERAICGQTLMRIAQAANAAKR